MPMDRQKQPTLMPVLLFKELKTAIIEGQIPTGSKISEPELAARYQVSRGTLRDALARLEACGLVERRPNIGARVVGLSREQLFEIFQLREVLEGLAARLAATQMDDDEITSLQALLITHREQIANESGQAYFQQEGDFDFHYRIVSGSHNQRLIKVLGKDLYQLVRLYRYQFGMPGKRTPAAIDEHQHIVNAIARRDGELAGLLMQAHVRAAYENVKQKLEIVTP